MMHICIIGKGSFVGDAVSRHLNAAYADELQISEVDTVGDEWLETDFSTFDSLFYVSGIVPWAVDRKKLDLKSDDELEQYLTAVNARLARSIAEKAKQDGADHLIFMSTSDVYAKSKAGRADFIVDATTEPNPESLYGKSKFAAESMLSELADKDFSVAMLRPPLVYGPNCERGSFASLMRLAGHVPVFPMVKNARSMLYTGNLAELVRSLAMTKAGGVYLPQDSQWICTSELVHRLGLIQGHKVRLVPGFSRAGLFASKHNATARKVFGNFKYAHEASQEDLGYQAFNLTAALGEIAGQL